MQLKKMLRICGNTSVYKKSIETSESLKIRNSMPTQDGRNVGGSMAKWLVDWTVMAIAWIQLPASPEFLTDDSVFVDRSAGYCCQQY